MAAVKNFNTIVHQIQASNLNYQLYLTPFAANISLKKTPIKDRSGRPLSSPLLCQLNPGVDPSHEVKKENPLDDVNQVFDKQNNLRSTKPDEHLYHELAEYKSAINKLTEEKDHLINENEKLNLSIKEKDREIMDLERANKVKSEVADKIKKNLKEVKEKFQKEKTDITRNHKLEVKYWRKQLGEETKTKIKLKEKLEDPKNNTKPETKSKKRIFKKKSDNNKTIETPITTTLCSLCGVDIPNYIPEYFCGEKYNPACEKCKENDDAWFPRDPFASFASPTQPTSLVSHWMLHLPSKPPQNPSSIPSLVTHCAKLPNPGDRFISVQEALKMMMERLNTVFR